MIIKLHTTQIHTYWETIKFAAAKADDLNESDYTGYFTDLLLKLLTDKAQCFVELDDDRNILWMIITTVSLDLIKQKKYLYYQCFYAFQPLSPAIWQNNFKFSHEYAKKENCDFILFDSANPRIIEMAKMVGFTLKTQSMTYSVGGA